MNAYVTYDKFGAIRSLIVKSPSDDGELRCWGDEADDVCEVNLKLKCDTLDENALADELKEIAETHRVDLPSRAGKLVELK